MFETYCNSICNYKAERKSLFSFKLFGLAMDHTQEGIYLHLHLNKLCWLYPLALISNLAWLLSSISLLKLVYRFNSALYLNIVF